MAAAMAAISRRSRCRYTSMASAAAWSPDRGGLLDVPDVTAGLAGQAREPG